MDVDVEQLRVGMLETLEEEDALGVDSHSLPVCEEADFVSSVREDRDAS